MIIYYIYNYIYTHSNHLMCMYVLQWHDNNNSNNDNNINNDSTNNRYDNTKYMIML